MSYLCLCGHVIKDNIYPCLNTGDLKWQPESEDAEQDAFQALKEFLAAIEEGKRDEWVQEFFNSKEQQPLNWVVTDDSGATIDEGVSYGYPRVDTATAIIDIFSKFNNREGHSVYRCPECERLYVQKEYCSDEYACYEKRVGYSRT